MKNNVILPILLVFINLSTFSQTEIASEINNVKVFKQNAQITRNLSFTSNSGNQEIVLTGISTQIIPSSLQVLFSNSNSILLSAKYEKNYLTSKTNNKEIENLQKQLDDLNDELSLLNDKKNSLKGVESILSKNQDLGTGNSSFTAQQVILLSNSYETKYLEVRQSLRKLSKKEKPLKEKINKIKNQLNEINAKFNRPSGNIVLKIASKTSKLVTIKCKYIVNNVGWYPIYDLRSEGITKNVQLNYKANIYQNTGVDWKNISVIISTGNPSQNNNRPILRPLYASTYNTQNEIMGTKDLRRRSKVAEMSSVQNMALEEVSDIEERAQVSENQLSIDFNIIDKQTINSDGKENLVALKSYNLTTEYIYHTVPKLNKGAFLLAKISNWSQYNLIPGTANIFFEGSFVGTSQINPQVTSDALLVSMGLDNGIVVERLPIKEYKSSKFIGSNKKETIGFQFIIKNKKSTPIKIEILDQIPVSQNKNIEVTLEEKGSAEFIKDLGKLLWTLNIDATQTKKERFIYSVKYPKKESIIGLK